MKLRDVPEVFVTGVMVTGLLVLIGLIVAQIVEDPWSAALFIGAAFLIFGVGIVARALLKRHGWWPLYEDPE